MNPAPRLRLHHRVRPARALRRAAGLRHAGPGDQRLHEHHRLSRAARPRARASPSPTTTRACSAPSASCRPCTTATARGKGQRIDLALLDSLLIALDNLGERYTVGGELLTRAGNVSFGGSSSGVYPTTDGHVAIAAGASNAVWTPLLRDHRPRPTSRAIPASPRPRRGATAATRSPASSRGGRARAPRPRWSARWRRGASRRRPSTTWPRWSPIPQVQAREMFVEVDHPIYGPLKTTGTPLKLSETPGRIRWLAPQPGEHNEEVFVGPARPLRATTSRGGARPRA